MIEIVARSDVRRGLWGRREEEIKKKSRWCAKKKRRWLGLEGKGGCACDMESLSLSSFSWSEFKTPGVL